MLTPGGSTHRFYEHVADLGGCGRDVTLEWHDGSLLYATSEVQGAVIDMTGGAAPVGLTDLMRRLPGAHDRDVGVQAAWAQEGGRA